MSCTCWLSISHLLRKSGSRDENAAFSNSSATRLRPDSNTVGKGQEVVAAQTCRVRSLLVRASNCLPNSLLSVAATANVLVLKMICMYPRIVCSSDDLRSDRTPCTRSFLKDKSLNVCLW